MGDAEQIGVTLVGDQRSQHPARIDLQIRLKRFHLPPVQSALVMGRRAVIGSRAMAKALNEMLPGAFERFEVEHTIIEAVIIREAHLRRVPSPRLIPLLVKHAEQFMADTDTLHLDIDIEVNLTESFEL